MSTVISPAQRQRGLSLIEVSIAISIAAVLVGSATSSFRRMLTERLLEGRANELRADLLYARSEAVARNATVQMSFQSTGTGGSCYVLHTRARGDCTCFDEAPTQCINGSQSFKTVRFPSEKPIHLQSNRQTIAFEPIRGTATPTSITLSGTDRQAIRLVVNIMGRFRSCAPSAAVGSLKPC